MRITERMVYYLKLPATSRAREFIEKVNRLCDEYNFMIDHEDSQGASDTFGAFVEPE